jgi:hypothetical protein
VRAALTLFLAGHLVLATVAVRANGVEELVAQGQLTIATSLRPQQNIVPGQHLTLTLEVATTRWFTGGTRITIPEVPGLVLLQTDQFASNASENRGGQSWVVQRWHLDAYPQRAGQFVIPPLQVSVAVNADQAGAVTGSLTAPAINFEAQLPATLEAADFWVASPDYRVTQQFDRDLSTLAVGDAFERSLRFEATDVMAMMLPSFNPAPLRGLSAYPLPPELENRNNRGIIRASRVEKISYIAEQAGSYQLPAEEFFWWHTERGEVELITLPAVDLVVAATASSATDADKEATAPAIPWRKLLAYLTAALALAGLIWILTKILPGLGKLLLQILGMMRYVIAKLQEWRKPGLPVSLNPESNAGD